jgi:glycosyltransferase involved in cell wall biosynthesis
VILAILTDLSMDHRCHKLATSLRDLGYHPIILCDKPKHPLGKAWNGFDIRELTQVSHLDRFAKAFILFQLRLAWFLLWTRSRIWISLDCPPLLTLALFSRLRRTTAIYDSHEIFTETPMVLSRPARKWFWTRWHDGGLKFTKRIITVSPAIIEWFKQRYSGHQYWLLPNAPILNQNAPVCQPPVSNKFRLIYQGGLRHASGLSECLKALQSPSPDLKINRFDLYGDGPERDLIKRLSEGFLSDKNSNTNSDSNASDSAKEPSEISVKMHGQVPFDLLPKAMAESHIGLNIVQPICQNYALTLSNKVFDYVHAGLPVLLSDNPSHRAIIKRYPIGVVVDSYDGTAMEKGLLEIQERWVAMHEACLLAKQEWHWDAFVEGLPKFLESEGSNLEGLKNRMPEVFVLGSD